MKYLIIGGTSLFGKSLIPYIIKNRPEAEVAATKLPGEESFVVTPGVTTAAPATAASATSIPAWYDLDVMDEAGTRELITSLRPDVIFYLAVQNSVGYAWENPSETIDINVTGTINLLDGVRELDYKPRVVIAGSGEEYGAVTYADIPIKEEKRVEPTNVFSATKACQTMMVQLYAKAYDLDLLIVRTFNEVGVGQSKRFAVSSFCHQFALMKKGQAEEKMYVGNLDIVRDLTDVRDLTEAFYMVAEHGVSGSIYNAGRGDAVPMRRVIEILENITDIHPEIISDASRIRPIDTPALESDNTLIYREVGWKSRTPLEQTIKDMYEYWLGKENV